MKATENTKRQIKLMKALKHCDDEVIEEIAKLAASEVVPHVPSPPAAARMIRGRLLDVKHGFVCRDKAGLPVAPTTSVMALNEKLAKKNSRVRKEWRKCYRR